MNYLNAYEKATKEEPATHKMVRWLFVIMLIVIIFWAFAWSGSSGSFQGSSSAGDAEHLVVETKAATADRTRNSLNLAKPFAMLMRTQNNAGGAGY